MQKVGNTNFSPYFVDLNESNQEQYFDKFDALPEKLLDLLLDEKTYNIIQDLNMDYLKTEPSNPEISRLVRDVVLSDIYIGEMPSQISSRLRLDSEISKEIAKKIVSELFVPVLEDLKNAQMAKFDKWPTPTEAGQNQQAPQQTEPQVYGNTVDLKNKI